MLSYYSFVCDSLTNVLTEPNFLPCCETSISLSPLSLPSLPRSPSLSPSFFLSPSLSLPLSRVCVRVCVRFIDSWFVVMPHPVLVKQCRYCVYIHTTKDKCPVCSFQQSRIRQATCIASTQYMDFVKSYTKPTRTWC